MPASPVRQPGSRLGCLPTFVALAASPTIMWWGVDAVRALNETRALDYLGGLLWLLSRLLLPPATLLLVITVAVRGLGARRNPWWLLLAAWCSAVTLHPSPRGRILVPRSA